MKRLLLCALLVWSCGVPVQPNVDELAERARGGDSGAVAELIGRVDADASHEQRAAVYRLLLAVGRSGEAEILRACAPGDSVRREHALALAANLRLEGALPVALAALRDAEFPRRYVAAWALGELGDATAASALAAVLGTSPENLSRAAARALLKLGDGAVEPLLGALPAMDSTAAAYAVRVLGEIHDPRAAPALLAALEQPGLRAEAAWALGKLGQREVGLQLVPHLVDANWRVRLEAARALGVLELASADGPLDRLRNADPEVAVREWAARSLALLRGIPQTYRNVGGEDVLPRSLYR